MAAGAHATALGTLAGHRTDLEEGAVIAWACGDLFAPSSWGQWIIDAALAEGVD